MQVAICCIVRYDGLIAGQRNRSEAGAQMTSYRPEDAQKPPARRLAWLAGRILLLLTIIASADLGHAAFENVPDSTWMTNGSVRTVIRSGNRIFIGGQFTQVRPCAPGISCAGVIAVSNVAAFDASTGAAIPSFRPVVTGGSTPIVYALAVLGTKLFIGGKFTTVEGQPRLNLAAVDAVSGALDLNVTARVGPDTSTDDLSNPLGFVRTLLAVGNRVYAGGGFLDVNGVTRVRLAAFDANGSLDPLWKPRANAGVHSLVLACDGQSIIAGGSFRQAAGSGASFVSRETVAQFHVATGQLLAWQIPPGTLPSGYNAYDLAATCDRLFVGYMGRNAAYAFDLSDAVGEMLWTAHVSGDIQAVAIYKDRLLLGGHFVEIDPPDQPLISRIRFAALDFDGRIDPWAPSFEGRWLGPWDILVDNDRVWVGGDFLTVSGVSQRGLAGFTNNSPAPAEIVVLAAGDIATCDSDADETTAAILDVSPGTVLAIGDTVHGTGAASEFSDCYDPTWGRHKARTFSTPGDREYRTSGASAYFQYFSALPAAVEGAPERGYYSFNLGDWHIVALNSVCRDLSIGGCGGNNPMVTWLREDLAANTKNCTLAFFHHPLFSSGQQGDNSQMLSTWRTLYSANADVVLSAHAHGYERFHPQDAEGRLNTSRGLVEFVVGTGGAELSPFGTVRANSAVRNAGSHGVLKLTLDEASYSWEFISADGASIDTGNANCH
jgi:hypothetical protein